jgi:hypothetical protein
MRSMPKLWPEAPSMLILTGAGIRQESGLALFAMPMGFGRTCASRRWRHGKPSPATQRACKPSIIHSGVCSSSRL